MAAAKIIRGQTVRWPMSFWDDDEETIPKNCTGGVLSITNNSTGAVITAQWTDASQGKALLLIDPAETQKMKIGRFGSFRVKLVEVDGNEIVYPDASLLVE